MPSLIFTSCVDDLISGRMVPTIATVRVMLVTSAYVPDQAGHSRRSDIGNEIAGDGYVAGGAKVSVTVDDDADGKRFSLGGAIWNPSSISASGAIYFQDNGAPEDDLLMAFIDFGDEIISVGGPFSLSASELALLLGN